MNKLPIGGNTMLSNHFQLVDSIRAQVKLPRIQIQKALIENCTSYRIIVEINERKLKMKTLIVPETDLSQKILYFTKGSVFPITSPKVSPHEITNAPATKTAG